MFTGVNTVIYFYIYIDLRAKLGQFYLINATDDNWTVSTYPNIVGEVSKPEKTISLIGPSIPIPIIGTVALGKCKIKRGQIEIKLPKDDEEQQRIKIQAHTVDTVSYAAHSKHALSTKVLFFKEDILEETRIVGHQKGVILTKHGIKSAQIKTNLFTGRPKLSWKADNQEANYDPHSILSSGEFCKICDIRKK